MRKVLFCTLILCLSFIFVGFSESSAKAANKQETSLRVATFNIDAKAIPDIAAQHDLLTKHGVEIVGLQEVDRNTKRNPVDTPIKFQKRPYIDTYFAKAIDFEGGEYGICLVSKYKFLDKTIVLLDSTGAEEQRVYERAIVEKNGKKIAVYNTHLSWESEKIRNKQLKALKAALDKDTIPYKIVMGDLNVDQHHKELAMFKGEYKLSNGKDGAWYDTYTGEDPAMKVMSVDNIITSKNIDIREVKMVETTLADHNLFIADLILLEK